MINADSGDSVALQIGKTMRHLMSLSNLSEADLCRGVNLPQTTINRLLSNQTNDPRISTLSAVANFFDITIEQLIGAEQLVNNKENQNIRGSFLPILEWNNIKQWIYSEEREKYNTHHKEWIRTESELSKGSFATWAPSSTNDFFGRKSLLLLNLFSNSGSPALPDGAIALISAENDSLTLRQIIIDGSSILLKQLFSPHNVSRITQEEKIYGVVVEARQYF